MTQQSEYRGTTSGPEAPQDQEANPGWMSDIKRMRDLGEQFIDFGTSVAGLAGVEAKLAVHTLPKLIALSLLIKPVLLLSWISFTLLIAWLTFAATNIVAVGLLALFLQHLALLLVFKELFTKYSKHISLPHTRAQIKSFIRSAKHEPDNGNPAP